MSWSSPLSSSSVHRPDVIVSSSRLWSRSRSPSQTCDLINKAFNVQGFGSLVSRNGGRASSRAP
eukprot:6795077-Pyramimonas_sp.AAC.1